MAQIELRLLGGFKCRVDGTEMEVPGQKDRALLAYLAMGAETDHRRENLAGMLWSNADTPRARDSLKHALSRLRGSLGHAAKALITDRSAVAFDTGSRWLDTEAFAACASLEELPRLESALTLYRGELLEGMALDEPAFDEWLLVERQRLTRLAEYAAGRVVAHYTDHGPPDAAAAAAIRALAVDPLNERACRLLMRALAAAGDVPAALKNFHDFARRLEFSLEMPPEEETVALAREIRDGRTRQYSLSKASPKPAGTSLRPSIAVLPLTALSGEADYFADGLAEEIATALSRNRGLVLIARGSSFALRDRGLDTQAIGEALGARYLVGGSAARAGDQVRLNVTLTDAVTGVEIWSEAYSELVVDIFELQDRIASQVVGTLLPKMEQAEIARAVRRPTNDPGTYDLYLQGLAEMHRWTAESNERALALFGRAIERDPVFANPYAMTIRCYSQRKASGWVRDRAAETAETQRLAQLVVDLAPDDALALAMAGIGYGFVAGAPEKGVRLIERALQLNPNLAVGWLFSSWIHVWLGLPETAIEHAERAMRLSPQDPQFAMMQTATACAHFFAGRESEAVELAERAVLAQPNYWIAWCILAAARSATGDLPGAVEAMSRVREIDSSLRTGTLAVSFPIRGAGNVSRWSGALVKAGLPD